MSILPEVTLDYSLLYEIVIAPVRCRLLMTGLELNVFNHLNEGKTAAQIAGILGTHEVNTGYLLEGLAMCGLLNKKEGRFYNQPLAEAFLVEDRPTYLGPMLKMCERSWSGALPNMAELVREGPQPSSGRVDFSGDEFWAEGAKSNAAYAMAGTAQIMANRLARLPEFPKMKKMLDLGAGPGIFTIAFVSRHPTLTGVVFDQPAVAEVARTYIQDFGLSERIQVVGGDFIEGPIGSGYDMIWSSAALNFARFKMEPLMKKIYDALNPDGLMISFHDGYTHEGTKPDTMLGHLGVLFQGLPDVRFEQGFLAEIMLKTGFKSVRSNTLNTAFGPMDLDIARK